MELGFNKFIESQQLFSVNDKLLLAVSGGVDSMVMCELFKQNGYDFGIAHCNFGLRGEESNEDELFVKKIAKGLNVPFYKTYFKTAEHAAKHGISVQMAARDLRYDWFEKIRKEHSFNYIAIAHHRNDVVETFFINLLRGTGIAGLHGIQAKCNKIVRPLLFANRDTIRKYATKNKIAFREDSSNNSDKYLRNKIRHQLIPLLKNICPELETTIQRNITQLKGIEEIAQQYIKLHSNTIITKKGNQFFVSITELKKLKPLSAFMYELLRPYGFSGDITEQIKTSLNGIPGKTFLSETYRLTKDRDFLIIEKRINKGPFQKSIQVLLSTKSIEKPLKLGFCTFDINKKFKIPTLQTIACLDFDKLKFPMILRAWEKGDKFFPLGMNKFKKLSDFFIDNKIALHDKEKVVVLCSEDKIAWIVGHRIDHRFRITKDTKKIFQANLH